MPFLDVSREEEKKSEYIYTSGDLEILTRLYSDMLARINRDEIIPSINIEANRHSAMQAC